MTARLQPKGTDPMAGKRTTAVSFGVGGLGLARVPRVKGSLWPTARFAPNVVKGRRLTRLRSRRFFTRGLIRGSVGRPLGPP